MLSEVPPLFRTRYRIAYVIPWVLLIGAGIVATVLLLQRPAPMTPQQEASLGVWVFRTMTVMTLGLLSWAVVILGLHRLGGLGRDAGFRRHLADSDDLLCPTCGHRLAEGDVSRCQECGAPFDHARVRAYWTRWRDEARLSGFTLGLLAVMMVGAAYVALVAMGLVPFHRRLYGLGVAVHVSLAVLLTTGLLLPVPKGWRGDTGTVDG